MLDLSQAYQRIAERALHPVPDELRVAIEASPDPERAVTQLERWLQASGNPATYLSTFEAHPILCRGVALLLGFSRQMGDVLVQNP
jgi:glutamine synthetase adenylyltransferase